MAHTTEIEDEDIAGIREAGQQTVDTIAAVDRDEISADDAIRECMVEDHRREQLDDLEDHDPRGDEPHTLT